ncbi:MAG: hypothetical protein AAF411_20560 [Myxococcota bacterium]
MRRLKHLARPFVGVGLLFLAALCTPTQTSAQGIENYNAIIVGARAASMGGAFTAVADDSTATVHNPAGLGGAPERGLSLNFSAYGFQRTRTEDIFNVAGESVDLELDALLFYPGATAYVLPLSDEDADVHHTVAFSIVAPRFFEFEGLENLSVPDNGVQLDVFQSRVQRMLQAGPSYAVKFGNVSFGASLFVQYATFTERFSSTTGIFFETEDGGSGGSRVLDFEYSTGTYFGLTGTLGFLAELPSGTNLGATVQFPSLRLGGTTTSFLAEASSDVILDAGGSLADISLYQDIFREIEGDTNIRTPWHFAVGAAQKFGPHLLSIDVDLYLSIDSYDFVSGADEVLIDIAPAELGDTLDLRGYDGRVTEPKRRTVVNLSLGGDFAVTDTLHMMFGIFTDFSSIPNSAIADYTQINLFGGSLGFRNVGEDSTLVVGVTARYGNGSALGLSLTEFLEPIENEVDARQWSISLVVGGSKSLTDGDDDEDEEEACEERNAEADAHEADEDAVAEEARAEQNRLEDEAQGSTNPSNIDESAPSNDPLDLDSEAPPVL